MLNFQPELTDIRALQTNQLSVERHLNDEHYVRGFMPGEFVLEGAGPPAHVVIPAALLRWPAIEMPDGVDSNAAVSWRKPSEWRSGALRVRFWYTSDVGSTNNFYVRTGISAAATGEVIPSSLLMSDDSAVAGPAVAYTVMERAFIYTSSSLGGDDDLFALRIRRLGTDANDNNVNDMLLLYAEVEHIPAQQVSQ